MSITRGTVVLLVGTSCSGKTSIARSFQDMHPEHFLLLSLDGVFAGVSARWSGGYSGLRKAEGFQYQSYGVGLEQERIVYGEVGWQVLRGMHRSVAAYCAAGVNVVVDDMLLDEAVLRDWAEALVSLPAWLVKVRAAPQCLVARELARERRRRRGLAMGHWQLHERVPSDITIDTSGLTAEQAASQVLTSMMVQRSARALAQIAAT